MLSANEFNARLKEMTEPHKIYNHKLIEPYITTIDATAGSRMAKLAENIPDRARKQIANLTQLELYHLLVCIEQERL